ncbi:MAG: hypothetical protein AAF614_01705 [Chloroflexota bacterium]
MANPCDYHKTVSAKGVRRYGWFKGLTLTVLITLQVTLMLNPDLTTIISTIAGGGGGAFRGVITALEGVDDDISELYFLGGSGVDLFPSLGFCGAACEGAGSGIIKWVIVSFEGTVTTISERFGGGGSGGGGSVAGGSETSVTRVVESEEGSGSGSGASGGGSVAVDVESSVTRVVEEEAVIESGGGSVNLGGSCGVVSVSAAGVVIRFVNNTDSTQFVYRDDGGDAGLEEIAALEPGEQHDEPAAEGELFEVYNAQGAWMSDDPFQYYTASYTAVDAQAQCVMLGAADSVAAATATPEAGDSVERSDYFRLQSMYLEGENKCLEGNYVENESVLNGAAFMDDCQDAPGQIWSAIEVIDDYFILQTRFLEDAGKCLAGNQSEADSVLEGAAFMADCDETPDQFWRFVESEEEGYFYMHTLYSEEFGTCLESNRVADGAFLEGAAYMESCQGVTGQFWKLVPLP